MKNNIIVVQGQEVKRIEYKGQMVLTFAQIDAVHKRAKGTAKRNFLENKERLVNGVDYFELGRNEIRSDLPNIFSKYAPNGIVLTKSGYLTLVKSLNDDVAWTVHKEMVKRYFLIEDIKKQKVTLASEATIAREGRLQFKLGLTIAKMIGISGNHALLSANQLALKTVGYDALQAVGSPALIAEEQDNLLSPRDVGFRLGGRSAIWVNQQLAEMGLQVGHRDAKGRPYWEPTEEGSKYSKFMDTGKKHGDGTPVRQLKWLSSIIALIKKVV